MRRSLMSDLGLDNFCSECKCSECKFFEKRYKTCLDYANMLEVTRKVSQPEAKLMTMREWASCLKEETQKSRELHLHSVYEEYKRTKNKRNAMHKIIANWEFHQNKFCGDCRWNGGDDGDTCSQRAAVWNQHYQKSPKEAFAQTMLESRHCRKHYYEDQIAKYGGLCEHCVWGYQKSQTCALWVDYLIKVSKTPRLVATLAAMKHTSCRGGNKV
eukprot:CAMPEP_0183760998 /NCGR_PEP_ID=MMETSP0739-20130205/8134_1 /TAXON_ID=385413 /ORGANISM="Thalassiosira miniscula, Strain CCMP1093" /LENGTH=213 /DNA_ID=CAMNT_0025999061 /DNA_START=94 /DNA_END=735 /DNA_ORIENTATION=+